MLFVLTKDNASKEPSVKAKGRVKPVWAAVQGSVAGSAHTAFQSPTAGS